MARDILALGGVNALYQPEALRSFVGSAEDTATCEILTDTAYPLGEGGDGIVRRVYLPVEYENGLSLTVTPIVNGKDLTAAKRTFNRTGAGEEELFLPLVKRGSSIRFRITSGVPTGRFAILNRAVVGLEPLKDGRPDPGGAR